MGSGAAHVYSAHRLRNCVVNANTGLSPVDRVVILYRLHIFTIPCTLEKKYRYCNQCNYAAINGTGHQTLSLCKIHSDPINGSANT